MVVLKKSLDVIELSRSLAALMNTINSICTILQHLKT
jgi:hypothetical protein